MKHDNVFKSGRNIVFESAFGQKILNPYYHFEKIYKNCTDLDTMDVLYNYNQYLNYDSLSRVHRPIDIRTIDYMRTMIKKQNNL